MIRGCLFGLSLSLVVVSVAGYFNANQQAREIRSLQRTVHALRQYTATEFAERRQAAMAASHEVNKKLQVQREQLALTKKQLQSSVDLLSNVESRLRTLRNDVRVDLEVCHHELSSLEDDLRAQEHEVATVTGGLSRRVTNVEGLVNPLRREIASVASDLGKQIEGESRAREQLAGRCRAALDAESQLLDSYCYALRALAESRKVRAAVEQELAAEAELEATLLGRLADDANRELNQFVSQPNESPSESTRIAQAPGPIAPRAEAAEPVVPELIDPTSGKAPVE